MSTVELIVFTLSTYMTIIASSPLRQTDLSPNGAAGSAVGSPVANLAARLGSFTFRRTSSGRVETATDSESDEAASVGGSFFETLTSSEFYKNTKVIPHHSQMLTSSLVSNRS
jgi:hypothetical protein